ncbi:oxidoreductase family protein [Gloeopeniophorella convolvens]|nr:oxidoreductase family protein [Gloeopeniophorella convolvens]
MSADGPGFAILGAGIFAKEAYLPIIAQLGASIPALKAVYSRSEKSAHDFAAAVQAQLGLSAPPAVHHDAGGPSADLDALLARADISAILVILPISTQPDIVRRALRAGKHVLSEKPVAPDVAGAIALIREYEATYRPQGLVWRVAENWEFEPVYQAAAAAVREGKIGKVVFFKVSIFNAVDKSSKWYKTPWRTVPDYQGGFLVTLTSAQHYAAGLRVILPSEITHLVGFASLNKDYLAPHDTITATIKTADGAHGLVEFTFAAPGGDYRARAGNGYVITGDAGYITIRDFGEGGWRLTVASVSDKGEKTAEEVTDFNPPRSIELELRSFFHAIAGQDDQAQNPRSALKDVAFIQAGLNSNGQLVDLVELTRF